MADLYAAVLAEVERYERITTTKMALPVAALKAAIEMHARREMRDQFGRPVYVCQGCSFDPHHSVDWPCEELRTIAVILGADVALEPPMPSGEASDVT